jgi:hypothetical protein
MYLALRKPVTTFTADISYSEYKQVISILKPYVGKSGWLELSKLTIHSLDSEEFLIFASQTNDGTALDEETCKKLMNLPTKVENVPINSTPELTSIREAEINTKLKQIEKRNSRFLDEEIFKLDQWADDLKQGLERELKELDKQIQETRKTSALAPTLQEKLEAQKNLKILESERKQKRNDLFNAQDSIDEQRDLLIKRIEGQLQQKHFIQPIFSFHWRLI